MFGTCATLQCFMANYDGFIESLAAKVWHLAHRTPALAMADGTFIFAHGKAAVRVLVVLSAYGMCGATIHAAMAMSGVTVQAPLAMCGVTVQAAVAAQRSTRSAQDANTCAPSFSRPCSYLVQKHNLDATPRN
jgi:hypothetical protein